MQPLPNHHPLWANAANDSGPVPTGQSLNQLTLVLARSAEQEAAFVKFLADQQNPASPDYHHWLTPAEVGERFGISDSDIAAVTGWLQSQGLQVNWIAPSHLFIGFGGTASNIGRAFQTQLRTYRVNGGQRMSVASDPLVPQALAPIIKSIRGLYTINDQPAHYATQVQSYSPELTLNSGSIHIIAPADFQTIYDLPAATYSGSGITIGIVGRSRTDSDDFSSFNALTSANLSGPTEVIPTAYGGVDPGPAFTAPPSGNISLSDQLEATLDVTRAGSVAPEASLLLVVSAATGTNNDGIGADTQYLVQTTPVPAQIMSISFGACEAQAGSSGVAFWDTLFQQAAAEGISVFVASGDSGAGGCLTAFAAPPGAASSNSPNYICSSSYATCVGGTEFNDATNPSQYWSSTYNQSTLESALSYIPEGAWNEPVNPNAVPQVAATGGGVSAYVATPSWQTGIGVPSARSGRYTPDVSFSSSCHDGYLACVAAAGGPCISGGYASTFLAFCGTSVAAPSMAGTAALLDQKLAWPQGNLNPQIYAEEANAPSAFHDATVASSGVSSCSVSTPSMCNNSSTAAQPGYLLTAGYDEATGLGSLDISNFLNNFGSNLIAPTVTVTPSPAVIVSTQSVTIAVTVSGGSTNPVPTGAIRLTCGNYTSADTPLTNGAASIAIPPGTLQPSGLDLTMTARYIPDSAASSTYSSTTGSASLRDTYVNPTITFTPSSTSITTAQNLTVTVQVSGGSGNPFPTGSVGIDADWLGGSYDANQTLASGSTTFTIPAGALGPGTDPMNVSYMPDAQSNLLYSNAIGNLIDVTVTQAAKNNANVTVTPAALSINSLQSLPVTIAVAGAGSTPPPNAPTGTVILSSGTYTSAQATLTNGVATVTVPALVLPVSTDTLTATYSGDYNNNPAAGTSVVSVIYPPKSTPSLTIAPLSATFGANQVASFAITVNAASNYPPPTGTVTLASGSFTSSATPLTYPSQATAAIPPGSLAAGVDTITVTYSGDNYYNPASASIPVTVVTASFAISAQRLITVAPGATSGNTGTVAIAPSGGFTGSVALTAAITSSPAGALDPPTLSFGATTPVVIINAAAVAATLTVSTTAPTTGSLTAPRNLHRRWYAAGGATLACIVFIWVPRCSRNLRNILGTFALLVFLAGGILACGGGGGSTGSSGGATTSSGGTTPGNYTITVTGTSGATTATGTVNLTIQ